MGSRLSRWRIIGLGLGNQGYRHGIRLRTIYIQHRFIAARKIMLPLHKVGPHNDDHSTALERSRINIRRHSTWHWSESKICHWKVPIYRIPKTVRTKHSNTALVYNGLRDILVQGKVTWDEIIQITFAELGIIKYVELSILEEEVLSVLFIKYMIYNSLLISVQGR